jgi:hypothetical protein
LPAKNDNAVIRLNRGAFFAGKSDRRTARSYKGGSGCGLDEQDQKIAAFGSSNVD